MLDNDEEIIYIILIIIILYWNIYKYDKQRNNPIRDIKNGEVTLCYFITENNILKE